jgi:alpha-glucoside transport system permease protein
MAVDDPVPLRIQVAVREMSGAPVTGQPRRAGSRHPARIAALALSGLLTVPVAVTVWYALRTPAGIGLGNFGAVLTDSSVWAAVGHSALWALAALLLVLLGLAIALLSQRVRRRRPSPLLALVIPLGMSSLVAGAIFRLIFDQAPARGTVNAVLAAFGGGQPAWLGSNLVWVVLIAAFAWSWLGFVVSLFRAGLDTIPPDIVRVAKAEGAGPYRRLRGIVLPLLRPVFAVVLLTMVVAAVRMFDLVLMVAPDPAQLGTDVLATRWWRMTTSTSDTGRPAALAVVLFALLIVVALGCIRGLRHRSAPRDGAEPPDTPPDEVVPTRPWLRRGLSALGVVIIAVWLYPVVTLLATAVRSPKDAGLFAWWRPGVGGLSIEALTEAADAGIWNGILDTLVVAVTATTLVLVVAVPAAYVLAWGGLPRWVTSGVGPVVRRPRGGSGADVRRTVGAVTRPHGAGRFPATAGPRPRRGRGAVRGPGPALGVRLRSRADRRSRRIRRTRSRRHRARLGVATRPVHPDRRHGPGIRAGVERLRGRLPDQWARGEPAGAGAAR